MRSPCSTRDPTIALLPFHSKRSGLSGSEEPETSSIIAPSAKISPALMTQRFVAFDSLFALGFALVFKAISSLRTGCARKVYPSGDRANQVFPRNQKRKSAFHAGCSFHAPLQSFSKFPRKWQRPDQFWSGRTHISLRTILRQKPSKIDRQRKRESNRRHLANQRTEKMRRLLQLAMPASTAALRSPST